MPRLVRGIARTAVVAGTATAVSGRVQRRQAEKYADRDAQIAAERTQSYQQQMPAEPAPAAAPQTAAPQEDVVEQLAKLGEMKQQGLLSDEEFAAAKARLLGG